MNDNRHGTSMNRKQMTIIVEIKEYAQVGKDAHSKNEPELSKYQ